MVVEVVVMVVLVSELMMSELMVMVVAVVVDVEVLFLSPQSVTPPPTLIITHKNFPSSALHHLNTFHSRIFQTKSKVKNFENIF